REKDGSLSVLGRELSGFRVRVVRLVAGIDPWRRRLAGPSGESIELHGAPAHRACATTAWWFIARERVPPSALTYSAELEASFGDAERLAIDFEARRALEQYATQLLGERAWRLLHAHGKVMEPGDQSGRYFSSIPP